MELFQDTYCIEHFGPTIYVKIYKTLLSQGASTAQKIKFSIKDFLNKCGQIHRKLRIWSHLLKKSLMKTSFLRGVPCVFAKV